MFSRFSTTSKSGLLNQSIKPRSTAPLSPSIRTYRQRRAIGKSTRSFLPFSSRPEQAFRLFRSADAVDAEFGLFLRVLCYTGLRLSEALNLRGDNVSLQEE